MVRSRVTGRSPPDEAVSIYCHFCCGHSVLLHNMEYLLCREHHKQADEGIISKEHLFELVEKSENGNMK